MSEIARNCLAVSEAETVSTRRTFVLTVTINNAPPWTARQLKVRGGPLFSTIQAHAVASQVSNVLTSTGYTMPHVTDPAIPPAQALAIQVCVCWKPDGTKA